MLIAEHTVQTTAPAAKIWPLYEDVTMWPQWDHAVEWVKLNGPFAQGTSGTLKPKGGPKVAFVMSEVTPHKSFTSVSQLPLTKMIFAHRLEQKGDKLFITHRVEMTGLLSPLFAFIIGRGIKKDLLPAMQKLVQMAEKS